MKTYIENLRAMSARCDCSVAKQKTMAHESFDSASCVKFVASR